MVPPLDECGFCVKEFWKPWLQELLDIEDEARVEERQATFDARDALSKSERDLALNRRLYAADALLSIRSAKKKVMKAIAAIEAEKAKRNSIDKEKYGIQIPRSNANTRFKEAMAEAFKSKQIQEHRFDIMKLWREKWALREATIAAEIEEAEKILKTKPVVKRKDSDENGPKPPDDPPKEGEKRDFGPMPEIKPTLKKKEDRHSADKGHAEKKESGPRRSKDKGSTEKPDHKARQSKDKGTLTTPTPRPSHDKSTGIDPAHGADKGSVGTQAQEPVTTVAPAHGADKGSVANKELANAQKPAPDSNKKEPGPSQGQDKSVSDKKNTGVTQGATEKKEPEKKEPEKKEPEKKEPEPAQGADKGAPVNKEPEPAQKPAADSDKGATEKK